VHLLDRRGMPVPIGVAGELCVGGVGVARGYLGLPELTAERFVPGGSGAPGSRLYLTGDLARRLADGTLEYLGRIDQQVKLRGYRVEPGEIEASLRGYPEVRDAAVVVRDDLPGGPGLVAFMVAQEGTAPTAAGLRDALRGSLPEHMVPAHFVLLEALPTTPNGKVNRRALRTAHLAPEERRGEFMAPRNSVEEILAEIWQKLLGVERVGVHDNFFDLGGHSLQGIRLMSHISDALGIDLQVRAVFEAPTLGELAAVVAEEMARQLGEELGDEP